MDRQLRELRRQALAGDPTAALQYFYAVKRAEPRHDLPSVAPIIVNIQRPKMRGPVEIHPLSGTRIYFVSPSAPNMYGGQSQIPINVYSVDYYIRCDYYYYPELGWTPHSPDHVAHAREHYEARNRDIHYSGEERTLQWYLQRPGSSRQCFSCGSSSGAYTFYATRINRHEEMGEAGVRFLNPTLAQLAQEFAEQHPDLMLEAELQHLNNEVMSLEADIEKERARLTEMEQQLAALVIRELQAEDQRNRSPRQRRNPSPWEDPDAIAWFEYLRLSGAEVREKELDRAFQDVPPDIAVLWSNRLLNAISAGLNDDQARVLAEHVSRKLRETPEHLQANVLREFISIILQVMSEGEESNNQQS